MHARTAACAALLLAASATACSSSGEPETIRVTVTQTAPADAKAGTDTTDQPKTATGAKLGTGQKFSFEGDEEYDPMAGNATVLSYQQPVHASVTAAEEFNQPGYVWAALEVKVCGTKGDFTTSSTPWTLSYNDGTRIEPSGTTYEDFPKPEYVQDAPISAGDCSRGKIVYAVPGKQRPAQVLYTTDDSPTLRWSLAK
ncbi:hypothetical protein ABZ357_09645 [Streptomyces sp. NPDC005917]|uniref:hypothetical protein n=1 Tax=unclassified Streptomyces TaxID=2593676 RepID=UPI0033D49528